MQCCHGDVMHVSELLNGGLVMDCHFLHLTHTKAHTHTHTHTHTPLITAQISCEEIRSHETDISPMMPHSHLLLVMSPKLLHLWAILGLQVFSLCWVTLTEPLLHSSQLRLLLQLQLLQLSLKRHLQRHLLPMEPLPSHWGRCCGRRRMFLMIIL